MILSISRYGKSFACEIQESHDPRHPSMCVVDALPDITKILQCAFPELEHHSLVIACDFENDGCPGNDGDASPEKGVDLAPKE